MVLSIFGIQILHMKSFFFGICFLFPGLFSFGQFKADKIKWTKDGAGMYENDNGSIVKTNPKTGQPTVLISKDGLKQNGKTVDVKDFAVSSNEQLILIFTNTARVWRYNTKGDYWLYNVVSKSMKQSSSN